MKRAIQLIPVLGSLSVTAVQAGNEVKEGAEKPLNIIYIMTDDHAQQTISCYDKRYNCTPNLDRLASEGVRFTNSFVCNSISGPSRAVLMTGKHSHKNGMKDNSTSFDNDQQTFPKLLQTAGYQTAMIGKWHLNGTPQGFDYWEILPGQGEYYNPDFITKEGTKRNPGYVTNVITDKGIQFLEKRDKSKPFCMLLHHKAVHRIWMGDLKDLDAYEGKKFKMPKNFWDEYNGRKAAGKQEMTIDKHMDLVYDLKMKGSGAKTWYGEGFIKGAYGRMDEEQKRVWDAHYDPIIQKFVEDKLEGKQLVEWKYQRYMTDYLKCVKSLDDNVGRLYDYLKKNDLLDNTLIVYTSDQGFYMGEHGWFDKRFMYEESMRTPLIMRLPERMKKRGAVKEMVQNIDYAPTFLELAGVKVPSDIQGMSLLPLLQDKKMDHWRSALYYHYYEYPGEHAVRRHYGIRTERYKLIRFYGADVNTWELFDLKKDPMEMNNLYGNDKYKERVVELKAELEALQQQYDVKESDY